MGGLSRLADSNKLEQMELLKGLLCEHGRNE